MIKNNCAYKELGVSHFDKIKGDQMQRYYVRRLTQLGFKVEIQPLDSVA